MQGIDFEQTSGLALGKTRHSMQWQHWCLVPSPSYRSDLCLLL